MHKYPKSSERIMQMGDGSLPILDMSDHYKIYDGGEHSFDSVTALVQSSGTPISLGQEMGKYMNTEKFWGFLGDHRLEPLADSPREVYTYNWVSEAQGPMIFDVGVFVPEDLALRELPDWLEFKSYPAMRFFSLIYVGPFPHQQHSGWGNLRWDQRAEEKNLIYNEIVYRELYHRYDYGTDQHVTEIQLSID